MGTPGPSSRFNEVSWDPVSQGLWEQIRSEERTLSRKKTTEQVQGRFDVEVEALKEGWGLRPLRPSQTRPTI